ncbi:periplasmic binding protein-like I [Dichotomocladium elegans]|nr:periplasmic binding protein-like I [Dichotomocladium elegans]
MAQIKGQRVQQPDGINSITKGIETEDLQQQQQQQQHKHKQKQQQVSSSRAAAQHQYQNISANISPFIVREANGSTYLAPRNVQPDWVELKVGVLLPFHQQGNNYTKELTVSGSTAIRMAANEINERQLIPGAYITLVEKDSYPKEVSGQEGITQPVFQAVSLIQEGVIGVIGDISSSWTVLSALMTSTLRIPQCSFSATTSNSALSDKSQYGYFFRTVPTQLLYADAALSFIASQGWPVFGILYTKDDLGQQLSEALVMKSKLKGAHVKAYQKFYEEGPESDIQSAINTLMNAGVRIVFVAAEGDAQIAALTVAAHLGHINDKTVWMTIGPITYDLAAAVDAFNAVLRLRSVENTAESQQEANRTSIAAPAAVIRAAKKARTLTQIAFNETFSGGVFMFDTSLDLQGYPPYETFLDHWAQLDPTM